jgi:hypothetical protein
MAHTVGPRITRPYRDNFHTAFYGSKAGQTLPAPVIGITAAG